MGDLRGDFLGAPHGTTPAAVIANKIFRFDPLETVKTFKGRWYGLYYAISGNESSSVALFKHTGNERQTIVLHFENLHEKSKSKTHSMTVLNNLNIA